MKTGKAPGADGYTLFYYRSFVDKMASRFVQAYNSLKVGKIQLRVILQANSHTKGGEGSGGLFELSAYILTKYCLENLY